MAAPMHERTWFGAKNCSRPGVGFGYRANRTRRHAIGKYRVAYGRRCWYVALREREATRKRGLLTCRARRGGGLLGRTRRRSTPTSQELDKTNSWRNSASRGRIYPKAWRSEYEERWHDLHRDQCRANRLGASVLRQLRESWPALVAIWWSVRRHYRGLLAIMKAGGTYVAAGDPGFPKDSLRVMLETEGSTVVVPSGWR